MTRGFVLDLNKCTGCQACMLACRIENGLDEARLWREVYTFNPSRFPDAPLFHLSLACNHCAEPPCMKHCPALAFEQDASTGAVLLHGERCIGCRYCAWACPFDAPRFHRETGVMSKCTFCRHRLVEGLPPVCAALCPTGALAYGDLEAAGEAEAAGFPRTGFLPSIRFLPLRGPNPAPECSSVAGGEERAPAMADMPPAPPKISVRTEWPLALFSLIAAVLVAAATASALGRPPIGAPLFLAAAVAGFGISSVHLGRRMRGWRAVLNWRGSWLSREVLFFGLFVLLAGAGLVIQPGGRLPGLLSVPVGFAALYAIDRVYDLTLKKVPTALHSAGAVLTGFFLLGLFLREPAVIISCALLKLALYAIRKARYCRDFSAKGAALAFGRTVIGILLPGTVWWLLPEVNPMVLLGAVSIGELVDRLEYYAEMDVISPRRTVSEDLRRGAWASGNPRRSTAGIRDAGD